jgi:hypothetical protein
MYVIGLNNSTLMIDTQCPSISKPSTYVYSHVHSIIHKKQKIEADQGVHWWMIDNQSVQYIANWILFNLKEEGNCSICYKIVNMLNKIIQSQKRCCIYTALYPFISPPFINQITVQENLTMAARSWKKGRMGNYCL